MTRLKDLVPGVGRQDNPRTTINKEWLARLEQAVVDSDERQKMLDELVPIVQRGKEELSKQKTISTRYKKEAEEANLKTQKTEMYAKAAIEKAESKVSDIDAKIREIESRAGHRYTRKELKEIGKEAMSCKLSGKLLLENPTVAMGISVLAYDHYKRSVGQQSGNRSIMHMSNVIATAKMFEVPFREFKEKSGKYGNMKRDSILAGFVENKLNYEECVKKYLATPRDKKITQVRKKRAPKNV